ncbi:hypothetical protein PHLCEN_2v13391 [Hermanssonia centrifuga]|uniref:Uncharacterized protein n=1 Tax=Hermanssonia centrifuga TaxID=98765 RepID=A0A2R6NED3_9APHY|nr:hypothetical protein PHLCEN_2v13391 [Hermanssonia centrifuga]
MHVVDENPSKNTSHFVSLLQSSPALGSHIKRLILEGRRFDNGNQTPWPIAFAGRATPYHAFMSYSNPPLTTGGLLGILSSLPHLRALHLCRFQLSRSSLLDPSLKGSFQLEELEMMHIKGTPQGIPDILDVLGFFSQVETLSMRHIDNANPNTNVSDHLSSILSTFSVKSLSMPSSVAGIGSYLDVIDRTRTMKTLERLDLECIPLDTEYLRTLSRVITNGSLNIEQLSLRFSDIKNYTLASHNLSDLLNPTLSSLTSLRSFAIYSPLNVSVVSADASIWTIVIDLISALPTTIRHVNIAFQDGVIPLHPSWKTTVERMNGSALRVALERFTELEVVRFIHICRGQMDLRGVSIVERALPELAERNILRFEQRELKERFNAW